MATEQIRWLEANIQILSTVGLASNDRSSNIKVAIAIFIQCTEVSLTLAYLILQATSLEDILGGLHSLIPFVMTLGLTMTFLSNRAQIPTLVNHVSNNFYHSPKSVETERKCRQMIRICEYTRFGITGVCFFVQIIVFFLTGHIFRLFKVYSSANKTLTVTEVIMQNIIILTVGPIINGGLLFLACLVLHLCSQLNILQDKIKRINDKDIQNTHQEVIECVKHHEVIIACIQNLQQLYKWFLTVHNTSVEILLSIAVFEFLVISRNNEIIATLVPIFQIPYLSIDFLIICYLTQKLIDESVIIEELVYQLPWYEYPLKIRKSLLMMLIRSQKPLSLKAGFRVMGLPLCAASFRAMYSYFALLWKFRNRLSN